MKNAEIAGIFDRMADILEVLNDNPFRVRSYRKASEVVGDQAEDIAALAESGRLGELPGIGAAFVEKITEYLVKGKVTAYDELKAKVPEGVVEMLRVPGLGPKTAGLFWKQASVTSVAELTKAIDDGKLVGLPGIGEKKLENIKKGIATYLGGQGRVLLGAALPVAEEVAGLLEKLDGVSAVLPAGSMRRRRETIGDVDILVASERGKEVIAAFVGLPMVKDVLAEGDTKGSVRVEGGLQVDVRVVPPESFGAAAQYFTGSKAHNIRLRDLAIGKKLKLNEYGVFRGEKRIAGKTEEEVYAALGLPCIPPELREDRGEVEAALEGKLPTLIEEKDIRGDLQMHSTHSDGAAPIEEMARACIALGYDYLAITDHSQSLKIANGLTPARLRTQRKEIDAVNRKLKGFRVLAGIEVDILGDGGLDLPDKTLAALDFVIASIHMGMQQDADRLTARLVKAMRSPYVSAIAHPTGRVIGQRDPCALHFDEVLRVAKETGTALEINAYTDRLDLNDVHARAARDAGVKLLIDTDAHAPAHLPMMRFGVATARRGWVRREDVLNTLPLDALLAALRRKRPGA
ncbi:MAG TPA: DNA polymerase/3'-5' exonuclease PolX [Planctomycetota bacterium]|nr:DNA polymerase/3'-5' exonuclease PolX [Planctomycetota bacterium]